MKHTAPDKLLTRELLCFVRDSQPTVEEFVSRFGGPNAQVFHVLRKCGAITIDGGRVGLNLRCLSADSQQFMWGRRIIQLDRDAIWYTRLVE
jgi:hypothetical protein